MHQEEAALAGGPEVNQRLILQLRDISHTMRGLYEGKGSQSRILIVLNRLGAVTQQELTRELGIQPGSVSEVLAKLEAAGLIGRQPSATDRRTATVTLTEAGQAAAREAAERRSHRHQEMFSCLSPEERGELLALLERINEDWKQRYPTRPSHPGCGHGREKRGE